MERKEAMLLPYKPMVPCKHPGCPNLVPAGTKYCDVHRAMHTDENRSASKRGYNSRWRRASRMFLAAHPFCEECLKQGKYTKATVVDHIVPHRGDSKLFWNENNWQVLCKPCHDKKTGNYDSHPVYKYRKE